MAVFGPVTVTERCCRISINFYDCISDFLKRRVEMRWGRLRSYSLIVALIASFQTQFVLASNDNPLNRPVPPLVRNSEAYGRPNSCFGHRFVKHQYARACYSIAINGDIWVRSKFTNNMRLDGDHFLAVFRFLDKDGRVVFWTRHSAGMNAIGGPGDVYRTSRGSISPEKVGKIASVNIIWSQPNKQPDEVIARAVAEIVCGYFGCTETEEFKSTEISSNG